MSIKRGRPTKRTKPDATIVDEEMADTSKGASVSKTATVSVDLDNALDAPAPGAVMRICQQEGAKFGKRYWVLNPGKANSVFLGWIDAIPEAEKTAPRMDELLKRLEISVLRIEEVAKKYEEMYEGDLEEDKAENKQE